MWGPRRRATGYHGFDDVGNALGCRRGLKLNDDRTRQWACLSRRHTPGVHERLFDSAG
jgi:hypothetical protein